MVMVPREDIRRTLTDRVASRVAGEGIPRASIEAAVDGVVAALGNRASPPASAAATPGAPLATPMPDSKSMIAALSGLSAPDLASRLRAALARDGIRVAALGIATRGRHTVVTLRLAASARQALERIATEHSLSLSIDPSLQPPA